MLFRSIRQFLYFSWLDKDWKYIGYGLPSIYLDTKRFRADGETFQISQETQQILDYQKELDSSRESGPVFEKYKDSPMFASAVDSMTNATKRDPLGIVQGRCWIDFAKTVKKPLLVSLRDDEEIARPTLHVPTIAQTGHVAGMMRDDANGWVLGRPIDPMFNRSWRVDRNLIEEYCRLAKLPWTENFYPRLRLGLITTNIGFYTNGIPNMQFILDDQRQGGDRKSTRLNSSHHAISRMPSSA